MVRLNYGEVKKRIEILKQFTMSELCSLIEEGYDERYGNCDAFAQGWAESRWIYDCGADDEEDNELWV